MLTRVFGTLRDEVDWMSGEPHRGQCAKGGLPPRRKRCSQLRQRCARRKGTQRSQPRRCALRAFGLLHFGQSRTLGTLWSPWKARSLLGCGEGV